jgi:hypothetical protein
MMEDPAARKMLAQKAGFQLPDLFRIVGDTDPFGMKRLRMRVLSMQQSSPLART